MKSYLLSLKFVSLLAVILSLSLSVIMFPSPTVAQRKEFSGQQAARLGNLSIEQQDALDLLRAQARDLRGESDKPAVAALQARIADVLWQYDQTFATELFAWAFEAARQPVPEGLPKPKRAAHISRQAASIKEVLARLARHDSKRAEIWLKTLEEEKLSAERASGSGPERSELLLQMALQLVASNPVQAQRLGLLSLSGSQLPEGFGKLLFSLSNIDRSLSDALFRAGVAALRRNQYAYDSALLVFTNYLFGPGSELRSDASPADGELLADYFVDSAWHQGGGPGVPLTEPSAQFFSLLQVRGVPIVARHRPNRLPELEGQRRHLAGGLTQEQAQRTTMLTSLRDQQTTIAGRNNYDIDEQIERAEKQKDIQVRDSLFNSIAHSLMRQDSERALKVAARIDDAEVRYTAEDDINLVRVQSFLTSKGYQEAGQIALKFNNTALQAKILTVLASRVFAESNDGERASELLAEANSLTLKKENTPDKVLSLLEIAQQFVRFDTIRGFDTLDNAIRTLNRLNDEEPAPKSVLAKPRLLRIKTFTVINGKEMAADEHAELETIDFSQVGPFVAQNYMQTRSLGNNIEKRLLRAKYLTAVAGSMLSLPQASDAANGSSRRKLLTNEGSLPADTTSGLTSKQSKTPK